VSGIEFNDRLGRIPVYPAAKTWEHEGELVELASNEAPWGPLPAVVGALNGQIERLNRYPDPGKTLLRQRIADRCELPAARVAVGNGSCELLMSAADVLLEPGAELIYAWPSFSIYPHIAAQSGARAIEVPLDDEQRHDLDAMAAEVTAATRLVLICNPNNPTGTALPVEAIDAFMTDLPRHVAVILDEAYVEFNALRHAVDRIRQPFSVNALAQAAAAEAIRHQDEVTRRVEQTIVERAWLEVELEDRGLTTSDSQANFVWVGLGEREEAPIVEGLAQRGVIIRAGAALGSEGHLRVTLGTRRQNERFVKALDELL
jgi:histidinol-phosphate aminotransferase